MAQVRACIAQGGSVELFPGTDDMGTPEYNKALQQKRGEHALRKINADRSRIRITYQSSTSESNATPLGRIANRSVRAKLTRP